MQGVVKWYVGICSYVNMYSSKVKRGPQSCPSSLFVRIGRCCCGNGNLASPCNSYKPLHVPCL